MQRTKEEVEKLKAQWKADPCWDLPETEGFEEHKAELREFQSECNAFWENERILSEKEKLI